MAFKKKSGGSCSIYHIKRYFFQPGDSRWFWGSQLVNQCSNGADCTEEEHQRNRRTEIKVTQFDEENVRVQGGGK